MDVPHLNFSVREDAVTEGANRILSFFRPDWDLSKTTFKVFTDGITNKLLGCSNPRDESDVVLIRVNGNKTDLLIDRRKETETIKILYEARIAPTLYGTFDNGLVYEYVPGVVLTQETCRLERLSTLVATKLADMHSIRLRRYTSDEPEPALWTIIGKFLSQIPENVSDQEKKSRFGEVFTSKPALEKELAFLKEELRLVKSPVVLCHNDLLLGNIIYNSADESVTFIDYEYADYNYQAYDIANHFNEFAGVEAVDYSLFPSESFQRKWLRVYLERFNSNSDGPPRQVTEEDVEELRSKVEKFTLASHFLWGVWSLLQAEYSLIDFDFVAYASVRLKEYFKVKGKLYGR